MGLRFMAQNRRRAKDLGGRELGLDEAKAVRHVLVNMGRIDGEKLKAMDADIERMQAVKLLEDLDQLHEMNGSAIIKLERRPNAKLPHLEEVQLLAWLTRIEELQTGHPEHLHIGHLLRTTLGQDPVLRDLNIGYLHLGVMGRADDYRCRGLIDAFTDHPTSWLTEILAAMTARGPLLDYLEDGPSPVARGLRALPEDPVQRARLLHIYADYIEFALIENAYREHGALELPSLGRGRTLIGHHVLQEEADPEGWMRGILEELGVRLLLHLPDAKR